MVGQLDRQSGIIEGLTVLALGCTGGKFKHPEARVEGVAIIRACLHLPLLSWAPGGAIS